MFEIVSTRKQQKEFELTWEYYCEKYGWMNDPYAKNGVRYIITTPNSFLKKRKVIGTIEFIPYHPNNPDSTVQKGADFSQYKEIYHHQNDVWEIDKLCLHEDYQRKGYFHLFFHIFLEHVKKYNPMYYIALMENRFYRMMRISYGFRIEQKEEPLVGPNGMSLVPIAVDVGEIRKDEGKMEELLRLQLPDLYKTSQKKQGYCYTFIKKFVKF